MDVYELLARRLEREQYRRWLMETSREDCDESWAWWDMSETISYEAVRLVRETKR